MKMKFQLDEMTYDQTKKFSEIILPLGSMEQHGHHLPLGTDSLIARAICEDLALKKNMALCPALVFGFSGEHSSFPGTIDLGLQTFTSVVGRIVESLGRSFKHIYLINFHGGNSSALEALVKDMDRPNLHLIHFWRAAHDEIVSMTGQGEFGMEHAGEFETSLILFLRSELVDREADKGPENSIFLKGGRIYTKAWRSEDLTETGSFGGARWASKEKGKTFFLKCSSRLAEIIDEIRKTDSGKGRLDQT